MIERNVQDYLNKIDRSVFVYKGVFFSPKPKGKVVLCVFIDADSSTQKMSCAIGVFYFIKRMFACRGPPFYQFFNKRNW